MASRRIPPPQCPRTVQLLELLGCLGLQARGLKVFLDAQLEGSLEAGENVGTVERLPERTIVQPILLSRCHHIFSPDLRVVNILLKIAKEILTIRIGDDTDEER